MRTSLPAALLLLTILAGCGADGPPTPPGGDQPAQAGATIGVTGTF